MLTFFTESKICYLHKAICVEEEIVQFKIPEKEKEINSCKTHDEE